MVDTPKEVVRISITGTESSRNIQIKVQYAPSHIGGYQNKIVKDKSNYY